MSGIATGCAHCGAALEAREERFCCTGCEMAYAIIQGAGLGRYYDEREACAPRPGAAPAGWIAVPTSHAGPTAWRRYGSR